MMPACRACASLAQVAHRRAVHSHHYRRRNAGGHCRRADIERRADAEQQTSPTKSSSASSHRAAIVGGAKLAEKWKSRGERGVAAQEER